MSDNLTEMRIVKTPIVDPMYFKSYTKSCISIHINVQLPKRQWWYKGDINVQCVKTVRENTKT